MKRTANSGYKNQQAFKRIHRFLGFGGLAEARLCDKENDGFDAVFLAVGSQQSFQISIDGGFIPDVLHGVEFLRRVAERQEIHNIFQNTVKCPAAVRTIWMICFN